MVQILDAWELETTSTASPGARTITAGTDRLLVVVATMRDPAGSNITGVSYGGEDLTEIENLVAVGTGGADINGSVWVLDDAGITAAADANFGITRSSGDAVIFRMHSAVYEEVDQANPVIASFSAAGVDSVDPVTELILSGPVGVVIATMHGGDPSSGSTDVTWTAPLVEAIENASGTAPTAYVSVAEAPGTGVGFAPEFTLVNALHTILQVITLRHNVPTAAAVKDVWTLISTSAAAAIVGEEFIVSAAADRMLLVAIGEESSSRQPLTVQYGGEEMEQVVFAQVTSGFPLSCSLWRLDELGIVAAATDDVTVTFNGTHNGEFRMFAASYENVSQIGQIVDTHASVASNVAANPAVLQTSGNGVAVAFFGNSAPAIDITWLGANQQLEHTGTSSYFSVAAIPTNGTEKVITPSLTGDIKFNALVALAMVPEAITGAIAATAPLSTASIDATAGDIIIGSIAATAPASTAALDGTVVVLSGSIHRTSGSLSVVHVVQGEL